MKAAMYVNVTGKAMRLSAILFCKRLIILSYCLSSWSPWPKTLLYTRCGGAPACGLRGIVVSAYSDDTGSEKTTQVASSEGDSGEGVGERGISLLEILSNITAEVFPFKLYLLCFLETLLQCFFLVAAIGRHSNDATAIGDHLPVFCACS